MGFGNYFKQNKAAAAASPAPAAAEVTNEKPPNHPYGQNHDGQNSSNTPKMAGSSRASLAPSTRASSVFIDEIKHEVMVNYLHQQQCSSLWVHDNSGEMEGVLLRKARNNYMACPPALVNSRFAQAVSILNAQVTLKETTLQVQAKIH